MPRSARPLPVWRAAVDLYLYAQAPDEITPPATVLNPLLDAVEAALAPDPVGRRAEASAACVSHCWIAGKILTDEGVLGGQAVAIMPIEISGKRLAPRRRNRRLFGMASRRAQRDRCFAVPRAAH